jgi:hypothetical protein
MKTKIIGLLICIMLLTTLFAAAKPANTISEKTSATTQSASASMVDVPVWTVGDTWTYQVDDISINYTTETQSIQLHGSLSELPLEVTSTTGDFYTLSFETTMNGIGYINANPVDGPVNVSVTISDLAIHGTVQIEKSSLGIKDISLSFDNQKITFNIIDQPFLPLPNWLHVLSAKFTSDIDVNCDISVALLTFPLNTGMLWDLVATSFSVNGQLESKLFNLLYFLNNFVKLFGRELIPAEIAALLPIIDFNEALTSFLGTNVFEIPGFVGVFYCPATETVSVPAGTYDAYNITLMGGLGQCYYAPTAGNIIRLRGNFESLIPFVQSIDLTLLDTTYT